MIDVYKILTGKYDTNVIFSDAQIIIIFHYWHFQRSLASDYVFCWKLHEHEKSKAKKFNEGAGRSLYVLQIT